MYATGSRNGPTSQPAPCAVPPPLKMIDSGLMWWKISRVSPIPAEATSSQTSAM